MLQRLTLLIGLTTLWYGVAAQDFRQPREYEFNVEGGLDLRPAYRRDGSDAGPVPLRDGARQATFAPYVGLSAMRRIPGLRAFYGVRVDGHVAPTDNETPASAVDQWTATAMLNYRAFLFDMQGDCDCPTWGNDPWFKKAFFVELGLGGGYQHINTLVSNAQAFSTFGGAYMARLGVSHRFSKRLDVYLAGGLHGIVAEREHFRTNDISLRPTVGLTYRPRR